MLSHNDVQIGDVIYFVSREGYNYEYVIKFGQITDIWSDGVCIYNIFPKENRLINGIPYDEFSTPTKWQKLPKGWTYNTQLFTLETSDEDKETLSKIHVNNPEEIKQGIKDGVLITANQKDYSHIETEITKEGFRLIRKYDDDFGYYSRIYHWNDKIFKTYEDAKQWIDDYNAELKRQSELTDEEWSIEQIQNTVHNHFAIKFVDKDVKKEKEKRVMDYFLSLKNIEDVEVRSHCGHLQWKYWKNKKWNNIPDDIE